MKLMKKALAFTLSLTIAFSAGIVSAFALSEKDSGAEYYKGVFYYRPVLGEFEPDTESVDTYCYSDSFFKASSKTYNEHLATFGMAVAEASVGSNREPDTEEGYQNKSRDVVALLEDVGFTDIELNDDYRKKPTKNSMGVLCARKKVVHNNKEYTLVTVVPRSAGYEAEWGNNFVIGADGVAKGFDQSAQKCLSFIKDYIASRHIEGDIKLWAVGFSRGAAVVNLIGQKLIDTPNAYLGDRVSLGSEDLYVYCFGTPPSADLNHNPSDERYAGIFTFYSDTEIASALPPLQMGFDRFGTVRLLRDEQKYDRMLSFLEVCNQEIYDQYTGSINPAFYHPKKLSLDDGSVEITDDDASYLPLSEQEYLQGLCTYLYQVVGSRERYVEVYEQPLVELFAFVNGLSADGKSAFITSISSNDEVYSLAAAMYAYFMRLKSSGAAPSGEQAEKVARELVALASPDEQKDSGVSASLITKTAARLILYLTMKPERLKTIAANQLGSVLEPAMRDNGATDEEVDAIINTASLEALVHFLSHLLLGNIWQSDKVEPLNINNEQIKSAATLIGNFLNFAADHANEVIISWLRTNDSYYEDYAQLNNAQLSGYRRVYLHTKDTALLNGVIKEGNRAAAEIKDGVLTNVSNRWIGFTETDDGGFFRIPMDRDYTFELNTTKDTELSVRIGEYSVYDAAVSDRLSQTVTVSEKDLVELSLPALGSDDAIPSSVSYGVAVISVERVLLGDADLDGKVTVLDATLIQKSLASLASLSSIGRKTADVDRSGKVTVLDATNIQRFLANLPSSKGIGEPLDL